ncbi:unnamed protein product [Amoebophrya sp. A25]|nr:unnamed protein product [Amoebophrya sp. A25]|eukprot:GSA25T00011100001.1
MPSLNLVCRADRWIGGLSETPERDSCFLLNVDYHFPFRCLGRFVMWCGDFAAD